MCHPENCWTVRTDSCSETPHKHRPTFAKLSFCRKSSTAAFLCKPLSRCHMSQFSCWQKGNNWVTWHCLICNWNTLRDSHPHGSVHTLKKNPGTGLFLYITLRKGRANTGDCLFCQSVASYCDCWRSSTACSTSTLSSENFKLRG